MKHTLVILALIATAYAALPLNEYLPPLDDISIASNSDLQSVIAASPLTEDGYRYKTVKRLRLRHRRDVNELPGYEYLPPIQSEPAIADIPLILDGSAAETQESAVLADDGYHYRTIKRIRYRQRRDVSELPINEYLPPAQETQIIAETAPLADDGYRYKTIKRVVYKRRT